MNPEGSAVYVIPIVHRLEDGAPACINRALDLSRPCITENRAKEPTPPLIRACAVSRSGLSTILTYTIISHVPAFLFLALGDRPAHAFGVGTHREGDTVGVAGGDLITRGPVAATSTGTFAILERRAAPHRVAPASGPPAIPSFSDAAATP